MKRFPTYTVLMLLIVALSTTTLFAQRPEWAGNDEPSDLPMNERPSGFVRPNYNPEPDQPRHPIVLRQRRSQQPRRHRKPQSRHQHNRSRTVTIENPLHFRLLSFDPNLRHMPLSLWLYGGVT